MITELVITGNEKELVKRFKMRGFNLSNNKFIMERIVKNEINADEVILEKIDYHTSKMFSVKDDSYSLHFKCLSK